MSLTGSLFLVLILTLMALVFATTVLVLPRLGGWAIKAILGRVAALLLVNSMVLLAAAVVLNDQFGFYADWTDVQRSIFGGSIAHSTVHAGGSAAQAAAGADLAAPSSATSAGRSAAAPVTVPVGPPTPPSGGGDGRVLSYTVTGPRSGLTGTILVGLPTGYTAPANAARSYPVLETFPGYPGTPQQWPDGMHLTSALDREVAQHHLAATITISPATEFPGGVDTECVDGPGQDAKVETWLARDVPAWVAQHFRVRQDPGSWATIGLSAGAWCAAMITMLHPNQYAAAIALGGYFRPDFADHYVPFSTASVQGRRYDLVTLAGHGPPPVALWVETSQADSISYPSTSALLAAARRPLSVQALVLHHAGHRISLWISELPQTLQWLGANIPGFAPTGNS